MQAGHAEPVVFAVAVGGEHVWNDNGAILDFHLNQTRGAEVAGRAGEVVDLVQSRSNIGHGIRRIGKRDGIGTPRREVRPLDLVQGVGLLTKQQRLRRWAVHQGVVGVVHHHRVGDWHDVQRQLNEAVAPCGTRQHIVVHAGCIEGRPVPRVLAAGIGRGAP